MANNTNKTQSDRDAEYRIKITVERPTKSSLYPSLKSYPDIFHTIFDSKDIRGIIHFLNFHDKIGNTIHKIMGV